MLASEDCSGLKRKQGQSGDRKMIITREKGLKKEDDGDNVGTRFPGVCFLREMVVRETDVGMLLLLFCPG